MITIDFERIKITRKEQGYTQQTFAAACRLSVETIGAIERGDQLNPGVQTLGRIADTLEQHIGSLFEIL